MNLFKQNDLVGDVAAVKHQLDTKYQIFLSGKLMDRNMGVVNNEFGILLPTIIIIGQEKVFSALNNCNWPVEWHFGENNNFTLQVNCGKFILKFVNGHLPINFINSLLNNKNYMWSLDESSNYTMFGNFNQCTRIYIIISDTTDCSSSFYTFLNDKYVNKIFFIDQKSIKHSDHKRMTVKNTIKTSSFEHILSILVGENWEQIFYTEEVERLKNFLYYLSVRFNYFNNNIKHLLNFYFNYNIGSDNCPK